VKVFHPPQNFEHPPFWNGSSYGINIYGIEVTFKGVAALLTFIRVCKVGSSVDSGYSFSFREERKLDIKYDTKSA